MREESGLAIPEGAWHDAGERTTPPLFAVRFRTRFFVARLPDGLALAPAPPQPEEIDDLFFAAPAEVLDAWAEGRALIPPPLLPILRALRAEPGVAPEEFAARVRALNVLEDDLPRIEFVPGIWVLPVRTATLPPATHTNVWMPGGRRFVMIDPGSSDPAEIDRLVRIARRRESEGCALDALVLTHQHRDHVAGAGAVARALGVPVRAHPATLSHAAAALAGTPVEPLADGEDLDLGGAVLRALHTPGHAPGHLAFHDAARNVLIAGDLVSGLSTILIGGLDGGDMDAFLASLGRAAALGCRRVFPAHGPPLPGKALDKALAHRLDRERRVVQALARGGAWPLRAIALAAYADTPEAPPFLADLQTRAHLERLERRGRARREDPAGAAWSGATV
jgi:glyoxylase-like metal-dependent hydrolase (beta-lactamase superfamily II)